MAICGCRCIKCKNQKLESFRFIADDGFDDMHHTCLSCIPTLVMWMARYLLLAKDVIIRPDKDYNVHILNSQYY